MVLFIYLLFIYSLIYYYYYCYYYYYHYYYYYLVIIIIISSSRVVVVVVAAVVVVVVVVVESFYLFVCLYVCLFLCFTPVDILNLIFRFDLRCVAFDPRAVVLLLYRRTTYEALGAIFRIILILKRGYRSRLSKYN